MATLDFSSRSSRSFSFFLAPLTAAFSRRHEFEADAYAMQQTPARDLANALPVSELRAAFNPRGAPDFETVAARGTGVMDALKEVTRQVMAGLRARLKDAGLTAMLVPTEVGGGGASHADLASVLAELDRTVTRLREQLRKLEIFSRDVVQSGLAASVLPQRVMMKSPVWRNRSITCWTDCISSMNYCRKKANAAISCWLAIVC